MEMDKKITKCELKNINIARKSIVAKKFIKKMNFFLFKFNNKRPGNGLSPMKISSLINKKQKNFQPDEIIKL